jgi:hypothetical protein
MILPSILLFRDKLPFPHHFFVWGYSSQLDLSMDTVSSGHPYVGKALTTHWGKWWCPPLVYKWVILKDKKLDKAGAEA